MQSESFIPVLLWENTNKRKCLEFVAGCFKIFKFSANLFSYIYDQQNLKNFFVLC